MATPSFPNPISLGNIQTEFGGSTPISISEYYRPLNGVTATVVPTSGSINMGVFRGLSKKIIVTIGGSGPNLIPSPVTNNPTTSTLFTIGGVNYWNQNIEKELVINGEVGSLTRFIPALTVSSGLQGTFTLRNNGFISGAGGKPGNVDGGLRRQGGDALLIQSSTTIVNNGTIRAGGGTGAGGRRGGDGGKGGDGQVATVITNPPSWVEVDRRLGGNNFIDLTYRTDLGGGPRLVAMEIKYRGSTIYFKDVTLGGSLASLPYRVGNRRYNTGGYGGRTTNSIVVKGVRRNIGYTDRYEVVVQDYITTVTTIYSPVGGCTGVPGVVGGGGGRGQGFDGAAAAGSDDGANTATNNCSAQAGFGGYGGRGGKGGDGGSYGQSGGAAFTPDNATGNPSSAQSGGKGGTSNTGATGQNGLSPSVGSNPPAPAGASISGGPFTISGPGTRLPP